LSKIFEQIVKPNLNYQISLIKNGARWDKGLPNSHYFLPITAIKVTIIVVIYQKEWRSRQLLKTERSVPVQWFNQHSAIVIGGFVFLGIAFVLLRDGVTTRDGLVLAALLIGLSAAWIFSRPAEGVNAPSATIQSQIGAGPPVLLEFQSPY